MYVVSLTGADAFLSSSNLSWLKFSKTTASLPYIIPILSDPGVPTEYPSGTSNFKSFQSCSAANATVVVDKIANIKNIDINAFFKFNFSHPLNYNIIYSILTYINLSIPKKKS